MSLEKTQKKIGHLKTKSVNPTAKTGRGDGTEGGQEKIGATCAKAAAPSTGVRPGGLEDNHSVTSRVDVAEIKRLENDGVAGA